MEKNHRKEKESLQIVIRRMREEDIAEILRLGKMANFVVSDEEVGWAEFWPEDRLRKWLIDSCDPLLVAEDKNKIVGFIFAAVHKPTGKATIENLFVREEYQNRGIGNQLLEQCLEELRKQGISYVCALAKPDNIPALEIFLKQGFKRGYEFAWLEKDVGNYTP